MVNWKSAVELAHDADAFSKLIHALFGLYIWEFFLSLDFDLSFITRKRKFRWPLIFYFLGRYCLLAALIGILVALNVTSEIDCQALYIFNQCFGNFSIGMASVNLSLRTIAVWGQKWYIVGPLVAAILAHWSLLLHGILLTAAWVEGEGCVITSTNSRLLSVTFIYTMALDFAVLLLTAYKLARPGGGKSRLVDMIFADGLYYFVIAFLSNLLATIFMILNLNAVMSIIANVPAAIACTIVASRVVRRLANFSASGVEMYATRTSVNFSTGFRKKPSATATPGFSAPRQPSTVHVQMNTFTTADGGVQYDFDDRLRARSESLDPEAQDISNEFKRSEF